MQIVTIQIFNRLDYNYKLDIPITILQADDYGEYIGNEENKLG